MGKGGRLLVLALALASSPSFADDTADARTRQQAAERHFALGEFAEAAKEYKEAFRLKQQPALLFNLAQCHRQLGEHKKAAFHLREYLRREPDAPNRPVAEQLLREETEKAELDSVPSAPTPQVIERTKTVRVPVYIEKESPWRPTRGVAVASAGAGVVALVVGIVEGMRSKSLSKIWARGTEPMAACIELGIWGRSSRRRERRGWPMGCLW